MNIIFAIFYCGNKIFRNYNPNISQNVTDLTPKERDAIKVFKKITPMEPTTSEISFAEKILQKKELVSKMI